MVTSKPLRWSWRAAVKPEAPQPRTAARRSRCERRHLGGEVAPTPGEGDAASPMAVIVNESFLVELFWFHYETRSAVGPKTSGRMNDATPRRLDRHEIEGWAYATAYCPIIGGALGVFGPQAPRPIPPKARPPVFSSVRLSIAR